LINKLWYIGLILLVACFGSSYNAFAQKDTLVVKHGPRIAGQVLSADSRIVTYKTEFTADPIRINWTEILALTTYNSYRVLSNDGTVAIGRLMMDTLQKRQVKVLGVDTIFIDRFGISEVKAFDKRLGGRFKLDVDLGIIRTKANNSDQVSFELAMKYPAKRWDFGFNYSAFASSADTISNVRANLNLSAKYNFPKSWFALAQLGSFRSTEQQIDYRVNYFLGLGKYLYRKDKVNVNAFFGGSYNREKFTPLPQSFKTAEAFGGLHVEILPKEKFSIISEFITYPSFSESGRWRNYSKTDLLISIVKHFRFGLGYMLNTDNKPPVNSSRADYLFNLKLGWSL
jgi:hypothetical protein